MDPGKRTKYADAKLSAPRLACARYYVPLRVLGRNGENMQREHGSTYIVWYYQTSPLFWLSCSPSALSWILRTNLCGSATIERSHQNS